MNKTIPLGLKIITGVDLLVAIFWGIIFGQGMIDFVKDLGAKPPDLYVLTSALSGVFLTGFFCLGFLITVLDNLKLKKRIIRTHYILSFLYLLGAFATYEQFRIQHKFALAEADLAGRSITIPFEYVIIIFLFIENAIGNILYFRLKRIRGILVN